MGFLRRGFEREQKESEDTAEGKRGAVAVNNKQQAAAMNCVQFSRGQGGPASRVLRHGSCGTKLTMPSEMFLISDRARSWSNRWKYVTIVELGTKFSASL